VKKANTWDCQQKLLTLVFSRPTEAYSQREAGSDDHCQARAGFYGGWYEHRKRFPETFSYLFFSTRRRKCLVGQLGVRFPLTTVEFGFDL
jgi:hypothetical protein